MAYSRTWQNLVDIVKPMVKGVPATFSADYCDFVAADMWTAFPFKESLQNIASGLIVLLDGVQDYDAPPEIFRATKFSLYRSDCTPTIERDVDVSSDLTVDLTPKGFYSIRAISIQPETGQLRLESAITVPTAGAYEVHGTFQTNYSKVTSLDQGCWFADAYAGVAAAGILYHLYKLTDDARAGGVQLDNRGNATYTGQYGMYQSLLSQMKKSEDYGAVQNLFPGEPMGTGKDITGYSYIP